LDSLPYQNADVFQFFGFHKSPQPVVQRMDISGSLDAGHDIARDFLAKFAPQQQENRFLFPFDFPLQLAFLSNRLGYPDEGCISETVADT